MIIHKGAYDQCLVRNKVFPKTGELRIRIRHMWLCVNIPEAHRLSAGFGCWKVPKRQDKSSKAARVAVRATTRDVFDISVHP